jgi:outer membrane protein assembly factor BamB
MFAQTQRRASSPAKSTAGPEPDWPQWHGPDRTNISTETGLLKEWPTGGPKMLWQARDLGAGYGTVAIKGDRIYLQSAREGKSVVMALNRADGKPVWIAPIGRALDQDRGGGPRSTPTVDGANLFVLTEDGDLASVRLSDGRVLWNRNILREYGGSNPNWHLSESPLVDDNKLVVTPGGRGAGIVALDKSNGNEIWRTRELNESAGYSSCIAADIHGVRTYMNLMSDSGVGVRASDGKLMWRYEKAANNVANCTTPVYHDGKVFYTSAYGTGCGLVAITKDGDGLKSQEMYFTRDMQNHHGGVVLHNNHIYGSSASILTCLEWSTGKPVWKDRSVGKGSLTYADGMLYLLGENQTVGLAEATSERYQERGRFNIEDQGRPSWAHPVVCGGKLYIRNQGLLNCYNVKA